MKKKIMIKVKVSWRISKIGGLVGCWSSVKDTIRNLKSEKVRVKIKKNYLLHDLFNFLHYYH